MTIQTKECAFCKRIFPKNPALTDTQWAATLYCARSCFFQSKKNRPAIMSLLNRIHIDEVTCCWKWSGAKDSKGYGLIDTKHFGGKPNTKTHRFVYQIAYGPIPDGMMVLHRCDNRECCNPTHLFIGDAKINSDDMMLKNRKEFPNGERSASAKLTQEEVIAIRADHRTQDEISKQYKIAQTTVSAIKRRVNWHHI